DIGVNLFFEKNNGGGPANISNTVGFNHAVPVTSATIPVEFEPSTASAPNGRTVGLALVNPSTNTSATVTLALVNSSGTTIATHLLSLAALNQTFFDLKSISEFAAALAPPNAAGLDLPN